MKRHLYLLHGCTVVFLVTLGVLVFTPALRSAVRDGRADDNEAQRNERSTPRSFILPATPAVAEEQEQQARNAKEGVDVFGCLGKLRLLGYSADDTPPALRARNLEAIFRFQNEHGLTPTAWLDRETVTLLKCKR